MNRRTALKTFTLAGVGLTLSRSASAAETTPLPSASPPTLKFQLGVASVSLKKMSLERAIAAVRRVGSINFSINPAHLPWENPPSGWISALKTIKDSGLALRCAGVIYVKNDEAQIRKAFDYVRTLGVPVFTCGPERAALPLVGKFAREYDVRVAIHNHGPEDKLWPTPQHIWEAIEPMDRHLGLCLDVGHSYRAGSDPVEAIYRYRARLYDLHLKDSAAAVGADDVPIEMGRGRIDLAGILAALVKSGYDRNVWFEYEKDPDDPLPGLAESVGYVRGLIKGLRLG
ncbi:MAG TPA: sugar phosphate isomerase/epimerase [Lacunisphaera sp.]